MIQPLDVTPVVSEALARLRQIAADGKIGMYAQIARDLDTLDNAGVFAEIDERNEYAAPEEILAAPGGTKLGNQLVVHRGLGGGAVALTVISLAVQPLADPPVTWATGYRFTYKDETYTVRMTRFGWDLADSNGETMAVRSTPEQAVTDALADVDQLAGLI